MDSVEANERTTDVGLFHYAISYHHSARALHSIKCPVTHPEAPVSFLYFHAVELYLKAFLRHSGYSVSKLHRLGHDYGKLSIAFEKQGGFLDDEVRHILQLTNDTDSVIRSRYIITGYFETAAIESLERTASSLHDTVWEALKKAGMPVR